MDPQTLMSKLTCFRVKELKYILAELGLPRSGRKQVLIDRIAARLTEDRVATIVEDTYRHIFTVGSADVEVEEQDITCLNSEEDYSETSNVKVCHLSENFDEKVVTISSPASISAKEEWEDNFTCPRSNDNIVYAPPSNSAPDHNPSTAPCPGFKAFKTNPWVSPSFINFNKSLADMNDRESTTGPAVSAGGEEETSTVRPDASL